MKATAVMIASSLLLTQAEPTDKPLVVQTAVKRPAPAHPAVHRPTRVPGMRHSGKATWYHPKRKHIAMWGTRYLAAHRSLRPGTRLLVSRGGRRVIVVICGFGPARYTGKDLDLGPAAFRQLAPLSTGVIRVHYQKEPKR